MQQRFYHPSPIAGIIQKSGGIPPLTSIELLICLILLSVSAFLASSEIALFSLSRFQLRSLKESFRPGYWKIKKLLGDPGGLLITILVVNEIVNIAITAILTGSVSRSRAESAFLGQILFFVPGWAIDTFLGILVSAPLILFFGEITPKVFAARANQLVSSLAVGPLLLLYDGLMPVRVILKNLVSFVSRFGDREPVRPKGEPGKDSEERILRESDFMLMLEEGHREGAIHQSELELIKNVFEFDDTTVASVSTPLSQVQSIASNTTVRAAIQLIRGQRFSRLPVTSPDRKEVVGILYTKDLLRAKTREDLLAQTVEALMRRPLFVHSTLHLNSMFRKFKQQRTHMAIVQNKAGETIGVVTMSDVLDALFEDLFPEPLDDEDEGI